MAQRGRKSSASLAIVSPVIANQRLNPPANISQAESEVWLQVINDQPATAFSETHIPLLELYCNHVVQARILSNELLNFSMADLADSANLKRYDRLLTMRERESRSASALATRLRITRQAVDQQTIARAQLKDAKSFKPWEQ